MTEWRFGTMGFSYSDWKEVFYPAGLKASEYLSHYARYFNSVELDTTFYAIPDVARVKNWAASVPEDFRFSLKTPRAITHEGALDRNIGLMHDFVAAARNFEQKLGVVLIQFPASFDESNIGRLGTFLRSLPNDVRFAVEFRNSSWFKEPMTAMLGELNITLVAGEYAAPGRPMRLSADFIYVRWVGEHDRFEKLNYEQIDVTDRLIWWQSELESKTRGLKGVFGYFNNDYSGYGIGTCTRMKKMLGISTEVKGSSDQPTLFG